MIPLVDLKTQYQALKKEIDAAIQEVLDQTNFILGDAVAKFEEKFAKFCDTKYCVGVASGTDALHLALRVLGIGKDAEVIAPANTFVATIFAISYVGAHPVLVDVNPQNFHLDLNKLEEKITAKTKAIIPVHLYGRAVEMEKLMALASKYNLKIIEDACQAHGASWQGKKVGSFGILGCFSFYPGKNLGAYGDGGAIVTSEPELYEKLRMMRNTGSPQKYHHDAIGHNSRLDTLQAAVLNVKLKRLSEWNHQRLKNAKLYNQKLSTIKEVTVPEIPRDGSHVFHLYVIRVSRRDDLLKFLNDRGVGASIHYPLPIYSLKAYPHLGLTGKDFPITEQLSKEILSLPMYAELTEEQIDTIANLIKEFYQ